MAGQTPLTKREGQRWLTRALAVTLALDLRPTSGTGSPCRPRGRDPLTRLPRDAEAAGRMSAEAQTPPTGSATRVPGP